MRLFALIAAMLIILPVASAALIQPMKVPTVEPRIIQIQPTTIIQAPSCTTGDSKCEGYKFLRCINNRWQTEDKCSTFEICDNNKGCIARTLPATEIRHITQLPATPIVRPGAVPSTQVLKQPPRKNLVCPSFGVFPVSLPAPLGQNDCALIRNSVKIEKYLQSLENIAAKCHAKRESAWQAVQKTYNTLNKQVDELPEAKPLAPEKGIVPVELSCWTAAPQDYPTSQPATISEKGKEYTTLLKSISDNVAEYCKRIDELIKPFVEECKYLNKVSSCMINDFREGVPDEDREKMHTNLNNVMKDANKEYEYTDFLFTSLQSSLKGFRETFDEDEIYCPPPVITQVQDDVEYEKDEGESKEDLGRVKVKVPWHRRLFGWFGFNPQPEPPAKPAEFKPAEFKPGEKEGFNPQPEPPGIPTPGEEVGFNPQPEPPGIPTPGEEVGFNPQPEPPGKPAEFKPAEFKPGEKEGFNPQPEPPGKGGFMNFLKNLFTKN